MINWTCQTVPKALLSLAVMFVHVPAVAWACSQTAPPPTLLGQPANDDRAVPTNVVLHYAVPSGTLRVEDPPDLVPGEYVLHSADGAPVALRVTRPSPEQLELVPDETLQPNTAYTLSAHWKLPNGTEADGSLSFETGDGKVEGEPEPPSAVLRSYTLDPDESAACGPPKHGTCVSVQDDESIIEYTFIDDNGRPPEPTLVRGSSLVMAVTGLNLGFSCVELRRFGANGVRSQPLRLCEQDAMLADLTDLKRRPLVHCSALGLAWCDSSGKSGSEPGPDEPRGVDGALYCPMLPNTNSTSSAQRVAVDDAGALEQPAAAATPAAGGCSATARRSSALSGLGSFAVLASLCLLRARRRAR